MSDTQLSNHQLFFGIIESTTKAIYAHTFGGDDCSKAAGL